MDAAERLAAVRHMALASRNGVRNLTTLRRRIDDLGIDGHRGDLVAQRILQMPETFRNAYLRAVAGDSPAAGIRAFCAECVGWDRSEVRRCTALACPLYPYRPYQTDALLNVTGKEAPQPAASTDGAVRAAGEVQP